jgi:hypothetical protein
LISGFGAAHATERDGFLADAMRSLGEVALVIQAKACKLDRKHRVSDWARAITSHTWNTARDYDRNYHVLEKSKHALEQVFHAVYEFMDKNHVIEKGMDKFGPIVYGIIIKVASFLQKQAPAQQATAASTSETRKKSS